MIFYIVSLNPLDWIATFFGWIMDFIFRGVSAVGLPNIGVCIIIFTVVTKILLYPLSLKQSQSQKLNSVIQPEIAAVQEKYKGKENDQQAMMMQQAEMKAVYQKYGTNMAAGCLPLLIQLPIIFGLYRVIINIPQYVASVRIYFENIINAIGGTAAIAKINEFIVKNDLSKILSQARVSGGECKTVMDCVNFLNKLDADQWKLFCNKFAENRAIIEANVTTIASMNNFLGIDLATQPIAYGLKDPKAWIIPILAGVSQYLSSLVMQKMTPKPAGNDEAAAKSAAMMNSMNVMMPIMSVVFCFTFASGIGVYWIAQAVVMTLQQLYINKKMEKLDVNELIRKNLEKTNRKRAKKGLPPVNEKAAEENYKKMQNQLARMQEKRDAAVNRTKELQEEANSYYNTSSIADRARMVQQYNEKHNKK